MWGRSRLRLLLWLVGLNQGGEIGFLADTGRLKVALTRARKKLVVIGESATLAHHPFYREFISYCESLNACRSGWEFGEFF